MELITYVRLINRAFVQEDKISEVINLSLEYDMPIVLGTMGNYKEGPYIDKIYKIAKSGLTVQKFMDFLQKLVVYLDMYNGLSRPYTFLEFSIDYRIEKEDQTVSANTDMIVYRDFVKDKIIYQSVADPILAFKNPKQQDRITLEMYNDMIKSNFVLSSIS